MSTSTSDKIVDLTVPGANDTLPYYVSGLEALETERREITEQINELLQKADDAGHNKRALREVVKIKLMSREQRLKFDDAQDARDQMLVKLGLLADTPLGEAALEVAGRARTSLSENPLILPGAKGRK